MKVRGSLFGMFFFRFLKLQGAPQCGGAASLFLRMGSIVFVGGGLILGGCDRSVPPPVADVPAAEGAGMSLDVATVETTGSEPAPFNNPDDASTTSTSSAAPIF